MATPLPKPPGNLHPLARELLESLELLQGTAMIEASRPLETIQPVEAREQASRVREWYYRVFAVPTP